VVNRSLRMMRLVDLHLFNDCTAFGIGFRQLLQVAVEVGLDLAFGFGEEAEVPFVAQQTGDHTDAECAAEPQRIKQALAAAEFVDARFAPGEVVGFFARGLFEFGAR
jgi:hypothetical protein